MLHIVNKSPFERNSLESCLRLAENGSDILLIEDAVVAVVQGNVMSEMIITQMDNFSFYVLDPDIAARGLSDVTLIDGITMTDYEGFVDLVEKHESSTSW